MSSPLNALYPQKMTLFASFFRVSSLKTTIATDRINLLFRNSVSQCLLVNYRHFQIVLLGFRAVLQWMNINKHGKFIFSRFFVIFFNVSRKTWVGAIFDFFTYITYFWMGYNVIQFLYMPYQFESIISAPEMR